MKSPEKKNNLSRRKFIKKSAKAAALSSAVMGFPTILPSCVTGAGDKEVPSNKINVAQIGTGRIARVHDMPGVWQYDYANLVGVCDLDSKRADDAKKLTDDYYSEQKGSPYNGTKAYYDYRELLENKDIDAVIISTPDHWHAKIAIDAAKAGKHIYMQKPASLTIAEGRAMSDALQASGVTFQVGSQQRSSKQFRYAAELVLNGRIGDLKNVEVGLPGDPGGEEELEMPIPKNLNYDMWLGSTPEAYYTEKRVHPQADYSRPGWLRCEQFGAGMITGWGAHHIDSAHWGMGMEYSGPVEIWGDAEFPTSGLWNVHGIFNTYAKYANGVEMKVSNELPNGVKFEGTDGWIFVTRGNYQATASDPVNNEGKKPLEASDPSIITSVIGENEIKLPVSEEHHGNWLEAIRDNTDPIAPVEVAHRSCSACLLHHMAMKVDRHLFWNPDTEQFTDDDEANAMLSRPQRSPYQI